MGDIRERRKKYLVNKEIQLQFVWLLIMQAAIPIILLGSSLYIVNKTYLTSLQGMIGEAVLSDAHIQSTLNFSLLTIGVLLIITSILLSYIGIRFSHHVAGPLYRLQVTIEKLARGEKVELLHFRKTDAMDGLAERFNTIIQRLGQAK